MSLANLAPTNTKCARENAACSFLKFLEEKEVSRNYLQQCMQREMASIVLEAMVDKFGMYFALKEGRKRHRLARHSIMQYFRQDENWLLNKKWMLEQFPQHRSAIDKNLLMEGQTLKRHCMKRESGSFVDKAPACTKSDPKKMMEYVYSTAVTGADYQDAALLCLIWFLFGPVSDLTMLQKANLSIGSGDIFFVRFIRIKTSKEQGLSLFPDEDFATCPLLDIALDVVTHTSPKNSVLSQLPGQTAVSQSMLAPATLLIDMLDHPEVVVSSQDTSSAAAKRRIAQTPLLVCTAMSTVFVIKSR